MSITNTARFWRAHDQHFSPPDEGDDEPCETCQGSGQEESVCTSCKGKGLLNYCSKKGLLTCEDCEGKGKIFDLCSACDGEGYVTEPEPDYEDYYRE